MYSTQFYLIRYILLFFVFSAVEKVSAQTPWSGVYGNEWLANKYDQQWIKIGVNQSGIQKLVLPASFQNKAGQLHLYHRGVEVALTSATALEIEFFGVLNDGASDALLYRPYTGTRSNPYYSWYSDESSYFLTIASSSAKLASSQASIPLSGTPESYHLQKELKTYTENDTYDGSQNLVFHTLDQSYLTEGKGRSSRLYYKRTGDNPSGNPIFTFPFQLNNLVIDQNQQPILEVLLNGRTFASNKIKASVGKTSSTLKDYPELIEFSDFIPFKKQYTLNTTSDIEASGQGYFQLESTQITDQSSSTGVYSVTYTRLIYPQAFNMSGSGSALFNLRPTTNTVSNISIVNAPANAKIYDITNSDAPRIITGSYNGTTLNVMVERKVNSELNLLVTTEIKAVAENKISTVTFTKFNPSESDYLIVTNEALYGAATNYANYRKSANGGNYKTLTVKIKDLYNQYNYGEPSPVALRRFADYMIQNAPREKHNLLLIGSSTTISAKLAVNREIVEEVPTIGFPGSDILLVEGLTSTTPDVPTIPVGRINATTPDQVENYLSKVIYYDDSKESYSWKKKILHLNGGKSAAEIAQFKNFLADLVPIVENGEVGGKVKAIVKQSTIEVEKANISSDVNDGVGMISYMGHGDPTVTDFDMGYMSDAANSYQNFGKYPLMYFNGCGVGNIFNGRNNPSPTSSDRLPQSSDWINSSNKGSIAVIANSYYSFQASSSRYLKELYNLIFGSTGSTELSIGEIQRAAAMSIKSQTNSEYDIANIHQSLLQGDPALVLIKVEQPDYSANKEDGIILLSEADDKTIGQSKSIRTELIISNGGKYSKDIAVPIRVNYSFTDGTSKTLNVSVPSIAFEDTLFFTSENSKPLSKITVMIDPENAIKELREDNNYSELLIEWDKAKDVKLYPNESLKDIIPPLIHVTFNNVQIKNDAVIPANPKISILLQDDRYLQADSSLVDVYLKGCSDNSCDFKRVSYKANDIQLIVNEDGSLKIDYLTQNLNEGFYELLVSAKDEAGNVTVQSFNLRFEILNVEGTVPGVVVSPNPASDYLHFEMSDVSNSISSIKTVIYDTNGNVLSTQQIKPETRNWYWIPTNQRSGLYVYKIIIINNIGKENTFSGKVALIR
jgi:hypothetical protein